MRWNKAFTQGDRNAPPGLFHASGCVRKAAIKGLLAFLAFGIMVDAAGTEKKISIYSPASNYSLSVMDFNGIEYVGLLEVLEPLGTVSGKAQGRQWKFRFQRREAEFTVGKARCKIGGKDFDLSGNFLLQNGRGLVPVTSLSTLLPHFGVAPITFHSSARRLFVGNAGTQFTAEMSKSTPPAVVLNFSAPVSPSISTEPGRLRMVFTRDPLALGGPQTLNFPDKTIPSATYDESNGAAEIVFTSSAPLMAKFSNNGRTITVAAPAQATPQAQTPAATPAPVVTNLPPGSPAATPVPTPAPSNPTSIPATAPRVFAVVDASHGGDERGAALTDRLPEKDVTLALARQLRQELQKRGLSVLMLRDADLNLGLEQRAATANAAHPAIYVCVHASSEGNGVRVYSPVLPPATPNRGVFVPWDTAQAAQMTRSDDVVNRIYGELQKRQLSVRTLSAPLRPLNNIATPVVAIEIAPRGPDVLDVASSSYEQMVASGVADALWQLQASRQGIQP
ncbi:MAG TPA: N-acetylmuramoyl-L-alanine amidase [Terriglobales bacterium]|nr:N-acetylmuramoyl-L-alanine amidase [Terriglobales bacterium]